MTLKGGLVYLVIIQEVCWILLLLQSPQCVLELCLKILHLTEDQSLSGATPTLCSSLLAVNDLMRQSKHTPHFKTGAINIII